MLLNTCFFMVLLYEPDNPSVQSKPIIPRNVSRVLRSARWITSTTPSPSPSSSSSGTSASVRPFGYIKTIFRLLPKNLNILKIINCGWVTKWQQRRPSDAHKKANNSSPHTRDGIGIGIGFGWWYRRHQHLVSSKWCQARRAAGPPLAQNPQPRPLLILPSLRSSHGAEPMPLPQPLPLCVLSARLVLIVAHCRQCHLLLVFPACPWTFPWTPSALPPFFCPFRSPLPNEHHAFVMMTMAVSGLPTKDGSLIRRYKGALKRSRIC